VETGQLVESCCGTGTGTAATVSTHRSLSSDFPFHGAHSYYMHPFQTTSQNTDNMTTIKHCFVVPQERRTASLARLYRKPEVFSSCLGVNAARSDFQDVSSNTDKMSQAAVLWLVAS
jgi:hypothetical protein